MTLELVDFSIAGERSAEVTAGSAIVFDATVLPSVSVVAGASGGARKYVPGIDWGSANAFAATATEPMRTSVQK